MKARDLRPGDVLVGHSGDTHPVLDVLATGVKEVVYNFRVADYHTYFVGDDAWGFDLWAHNRSGCSVGGISSYGREAERRAMNAATRRGEIVIDTQWRQGFASRGFDFISVRFVNGRAEVYINEVKRFRNPLYPSNFTAFGLGRGGRGVFDENMRRARAAIADPASSLTGSQRQQVLAALRTNAARIRGPIQISNATR